MILQTARYEHSETPSALARLAYVTFLLFFVVVVFGTDMPFQERTRDVEDIGTSNQSRQIAYTALCGMAMLALVPRRGQAWRLLCTDKWLMGFLLWCGLSIVWSEFHFVSLKRFVQVIISIVIMVAFLLHHQSLEPAFRILRRLVGLYLVLCAITIVLIPGATDAYGDWRGLANDKNTLGQISLLGLLLGAYGLHNASAARRTVTLGMMGLAGLLLLGSRSMTAVLTAGLIGTIAFIEWIAQRLATVGLGRTFVGWILIWVGAVVLVVYCEPSVTDRLFELLGKDATFTDRTSLWEVLIAQAKQHWLVGCGFDGFWVIGNKAVLQMYETDFVWLPNEGHNGYLDLWNENGVVGLGLFLGMVLWYGRHVRRCAQAYAGRWLYLSALVINLMESTFFRLNNGTGMLFALAYLSVALERMLMRAPGGVHAEHLTPALNVPLDKTPIERA
jgi:exopolysaccharide production protein ExoQ